MLFIWMEGKEASWREMDGRMLTPDPRLLLVFDRMLYWCRQTPRPILLNTPPFPNNTPPRTAALLHPRLAPRSAALPAEAGRAGAPARQRGRRAGGHSGGGQPRRLARPVGVVLCVGGSCVGGVLVSVCIHTYKKREARATRTGQATNPSILPYPSNTNPNPKPGSATGRPCWAWMWRWTSPPSSRSGSSSASPLAASCTTGKRVLCGLGCVVFGSIDHSTVVFGSIDHSTSATHAWTYTRPPVCAACRILSDPFSAHPTTLLPPNQPPQKTHNHTHSPKLAILDEATSALDLASEAKMYSVLADIPDISYVSVGHRPSLLGFHDARLTLTGGGYHLDQLPPSSVGAMEGGRVNLNGTVV